MPTFFLDTWQGSGSIHGHVPDQGGGNWVHQSISGFPVSSSIVSGGKASLAAENGLVYVDYFGAMPKDVTTFTAEFEFLTESSTSSTAGTEFGAVFGLSSDGSNVEFRAGGYYYSYPGNGFYDPPKFSSLVLGAEDYTSSEVDAAKPVTGGTRTIKIIVSDGNQSVALDGEVFLSATQALPKDVTKIFLSFKLLGRHSLKRVAVTGDGERLFWTRFVRTAEVRNNQGSAS